MPMDSLHLDVAAVEKIDAVPLILDVICRTTGMGFAAVARVTDDRWVACSVKDNIGFGLKPGGELPVATTICDQIRDSGEGVVFDNADDHPVFCNHHTPATYGLKSYISLPIVLRDGTFFGTLCAIDPAPHRVDTPETIGMFKLFAELIAQHLDNNARRDASDARVEESRARADASDALLLEAAEAAELREQFIAVLGHDLRNPLGAISSGVQVLRRDPSEDRKAHVLALIEKSVFRMGELIENLLDFARGRLGAGISLQREDHETLEPMLSQVINELRIVWPDREVETRFDFRHPVSADGHRISQMASNLLGNAFTHGDPGRPVILSAACRDGLFVMTVSNGGAPIGPLAMKRLFQPFERGAVHSGRQGLGLGLYIASEIARAHGGELMAESTAKETLFRFRMPARLT
jgi:signal transduction histidine kinase